jgi:acetyl esterase/lipase
MGGSAGGNLTAAVALKYASQPELKASGLIIACPSTCDRRVFPEEYKKRWTPEKYADAPMIGREIMDWAFGRDLQATWGQLVPTIELAMLTWDTTELYKAPSPEEPLSSVLLHQDIKHLPPTYIAAPTKDPTHQETVFLYEEMKKQGVRADLVEWEGFPHFFWIIPMLKETAKFMDVWNEKLRGLIGGAKG